MKSLLYTSLALFSAHLASAAIVITNLPGGELSVTIDAPLVFTSNTTSVTGGAMLVFPDVYAVGQSSVTRNFSSSTISLTGPAGFISAPPIDAESADARTTSDSAPEFNSNDLAINFLFEFDAYSAGQTFTISIGQAATIAAMNLPTNGGSIGLYLLNEDNEIFTNTLFTDVYFGSVPEPSLASMAVGFLMLLAFATRRRR